MLCIVTINILYFDFVLAKIMVYYNIDFALENIIVYYNIGNDLSNKKDWYNDLSKMINLEKLTLEF